MTMQAISQYPNLISLWVKEVDDDGNLHVRVQGAQMPDNALDLVLPEWVAPYLLPLSNSGLQVTAGLVGKTLTLHKQ